MNELIKIEQHNINHKTTESISARDLHKLLEIGKDFSNWFKHQIESLGLIDNVDYIRFAQKGEANNATLIEYYVTIEIAKHISMASRCAKGREVREYFIECEKKLTTQTQLPQTYLAALEQLVATEKERARIESINNALLHTMKTYTTSELAKEIGFRSASKLNIALKEKQIQFKLNGTWILYADYAELELQEIKQGITEHQHIYYNAQWTNKGRQFILALFGIGS